MDILIFFDEAENHAITAQEGEIENDDPRSFISSIRKLMDDWMVKAEVIELIPNDVGDCNQAIRMLVHDMKEHGMSRDDVATNLATAMFEVFKGE